MFVGFYSTTMTTDRFQKHLLGSEYFEGRSENKTFKYLGVIIMETTLVLLASNSRCFLCMYKGAKWNS